MEGAIIRGEQARRTAAQQGYFWRGGPSCRRFFGIAQSLHLLTSGGCSSNPKQPNVEEAGGSGVL